MGRRNGSIVSEEEARQKTWPDMPTKPDNLIWRVGQIWNTISAAVGTHDEVVIALDGMMADPMRARLEELASCSRLRQLAFRAALSWLALMSSGKTSSLGRQLYRSSTLVGAQNSVPP